MIKKKIKTSAEKTGVNSFTFRSNVEKKKTR